MFVCNMNQTLVDTVANNVVVDNDLREQAGLTIWDDEWVGQPHHWERYEVLWQRALADGKLITFEE